jgi:hypothetical protein
VKSGLLILILFLSSGVSAQDISELSQEQKDSLYEAEIPGVVYSCIIGKFDTNRIHFTYSLRLYLDTVNRYSLELLEETHSELCGQFGFHDLSTGIFYEKNDTLFLNDQQGNLHFSLLKSGNRLSPIQFFSLNRSFDKSFTGNVSAHHFYSFDDEDEEKRCHEYGKEPVVGDVEGIYVNNPFSLSITGGRFDISVRNFSFFSGRWRWEDNALLLIDEKQDVVFTLFRRNDGHIITHSKFFGGCWFYKSVAKE